MKKMSIFLYVLSGIGLLIWCVCFALGVNYLQGGALMVSAILFLALLIFMGLLLYLMIRWSRPTSTDHRANAKLKEIISVCLYVVIVLGTASYVSRFIVIETEVKNELQPLVVQRITEIERVFGDKSTSGSYLNFIDVTIKPQCKVYLRGQQYTDDDIETTLARLEDDLTMDGDYAELMDEVNSFLSSCRYSVQNWVPVTLNKYLSQLDNNTQDWLSKVVSMSKVVFMSTNTNNDWIKKADVEPYDPSVKVSTDFNDRIMNPVLFSVLSIVSILILQVFILLSYLVGRNWSVNGPKRWKNSNIASWDPDKQNKNSAFDATNSSRRSKSDNLKSNDSDKFVQI